MNEYLQSIKAYLYDRAVSPLFGTFAASWIFWNYKVVAILLSTLDVRTQFAYIETLYPDIMARATTGFAYPLASAITFIFVYPLLAEPLYKYARRRQKALLEIKRGIEDETPLTVEESRLIKKEAFTRALEFERILEERNQTISQLKESLSKIKNVDNSPPIAEPSLTDDITQEIELTTGQITTLDKVAASESGVFESRLAALDIYKTNRNLALFELGELVKMELMTALLRREPNKNKNERFYTITHEGRKVLAKKYEHVLTPTNVA
jgi:hypothetical protein